MLGLRILLLVFVLGYINTAQADDVSQVEEVYSSLQKAKSEVKKTEISSRKLMGTLYNIRRKMRKMSLRRDRLSAEVFYVKGSVVSLEEELFKIQTKVSEQKQSLRTRLRSMYMLGDTAVLNMIFTQMSASDLDKAMRVLNKLSQRDVRLISELSESLKKVEKKKKKLGSKLSKIGRLRKKLEINEKKLKKVSFTKKVILSKLSRKKKKFLSTIDKLKTQGRELVVSNNEPLAQLFTDEFYEMKGVLALPVTGKIYQDFGIYLNKEYGYKYNKKGVFIKTINNEVVKSVYSGKVTFADQIDGFGKVIVVDHGNNYYTVYGSLKEVIVEKGMSISASQEIAKSSGQYLKGHKGVYFEIRHFSDALNPNKWFRNGLQVSSR